MTKARKRSYTAAGDPNSLPSSPPKDSAADPSGPAATEPVHDARKDQKVIDVYVVLADAETGDWIGQPVPTGRQTTYRDWWKRQDTGHEHYRTYVNPDGEELAIIIQWVFH